MAQIEVIPEHHTAARTYTTRSLIQGNVTVSSDKTFLATRSRISFVGVSTRRLELVHFRDGRATEQTFLDMSMPSDSLPQHECIKAGEGHAVPFDFRVPEQLTIGVCRHDDVDPSLAEQHHQLPPTLGNDSHDMTPDLTSIEYFIEAKVSGHYASTPEKQIILQKRLPVRVLPTYHEEAPLDVQAGDVSFKPAAQILTSPFPLRSAKGELRASAHQPPAIMLNPDNFETSTSSTTIDLTFTPYCDKARPPPLKRVCGKVISNTYFGPRMISDWPDRGSGPDDRASPLINYTVGTSLLNERDVVVDWVKEDTTLNPESCSDSDRPTTRYVARVKVPFTLPHSEKRRFLPTFHSCMVSRTYSLQLCLFIAPLARCIKLALPLQIGVDPVEEPTDVESRDDGELLK